MHLHKTCRPEELSILVRPSWTGVERRDSSCTFVGRTRNLMSVGHDMLITARYSPGKYPQIIV